MAMTIDKKPMIVVSAKEGSTAMASIKMYGEYLLPIEDALGIVKLMSHAEKIEYNWTDKVYELKIGTQDGLIEFKVLSAIQIAQIALSK